MHHVVAGALLLGERVLLAHRSLTRRWYPDVWDLPGGHVDDGEDELAALRRELHEEIGVREVVVDDGPPARFEEPAMGLRLGIWVVRGWAGTPVNRAPDEHDELRWVARPELAGLRLAHPRYAGLLGSLLPGQSPARRSSPAPVGEKPQASR